MVATVEETEADFSDIELFLEECEKDTEEDYGIEIGLSVTAEEDQTVSSSSQTSTESKKPAPPKKGVKKRKKSYKYPAGTFTKEEAITKSLELLVMIMDQVLVDPLFQMETPFARDAFKLADSVKRKVDTSTFKTFARELVITVWPAIEELEGKTWSGGSKDNMWMTFHSVRSCTSLKNAWNEFLASEGIHCEASQKSLLLQHINGMCLELLLQKFLQVESTGIKPQPEPISKNEEQALRYCAGYIPYKLLKHFSKMKKTQVTEDIVLILKSWGSDPILEKSDCETYVDYTKTWLQLQNRGGLFQLNDQVFDFFRTLEEATRKHLSISDIEKLNLVTILSKLESDDKLKQVWDQIVPNPVVSGQLLERVLKAWVRMRCDGFLKVYENILAKQEDTLKQKEKGLRKELKKSVAQ